MRLCGVITGARFNWRSALTVARLWGHLQARAVKKKLEKTAEKRGFFDASVLIRSQQGFTEVGGHSVCSHPDACLLVVARG